MRWRWANFCMNIRWWLLRKIIPTPEIECYAGRNHVGPCMIVRTPNDVVKFSSRFSHDAVRALHCDGYTFFFYKPIVEFYRYDDPRRINGENTH